MPIRKPDLLDTIRIFRKLRYGKLLDLIMLDTRLYDRDEQDGAATNDPNRHMMGPCRKSMVFPTVARHYDNLENHRQPGDVCANESVWANTQCRPMGWI
jgi:hypothetical protein